MSLRFDGKRRLEAAQQTQEPRTGLVGRAVRSIRRRFGVAYISMAIGRAKLEPERLRDEGAVVKETREKPRTETGIPKIDLLPHLNMNIVLIGALERARASPVEDPVFPVFTMRKPAPGEIEADRLLRRDLLMFSPRELCTSIYYRYPEQFGRSEKKLARK